jgi:hypothetical protein
MHGGVVKIEDRDAGSARCGVLGIGGALGNAGNEDQQNCHDQKESLVGHRSSFEAKSGWKQVCLLLAFCQGKSAKGERLRASECAQK